ncbi:MAG TPA: peptide-binding protein [Candidatus Tectomicrobia bacterium]|jgi:peptide/nickel transport system substrate-binding protein|nr:peptide-binding protein [Candidatus Tectomicrobia bacterium]
MVTTPLPRSNGFSGLRYVGLGLVLLVLTAAPVAQAGQSAPSTPVTGDWLLAHILSDPEQLNPLTSNDAGASSLLGYMFESLLQRDPRTLELRPQLAVARPDISEDKLEYTFKLRQDVRFQDGQPLTGEDVLFSIKAIKCPLVNAPFQRVYYESIVDAQLIDPYTIRFKAREPYFLNESVLGGIDVLPRHYYDPENLLKGVTVTALAGDYSAHEAQVRKFAEHFNQSYARNPLGSGPYKFKSWSTGQEVVLERDADYWGNGKEGIDQVYLDVRKFRVINNMDAALVNLKAGNLDTMGLQPLQHLRQTSGGRFEKDYEKYIYSTPSYTYIGWNNAHPIFRDMRVRQAMTYFTNRQQMVKTILFDLGQIVDGPIYRFRPEYDENLFSHPYDPQKALALLAEAGWKDTDGDGILDKEIDGQRVAFRFEIKFNSGNDIRKSVALALQDELRKHGIDANVRALDWTIFLDEVRNQKFDAVILGWAMSVNEPDAYQVWHSSQAENKGSNMISYKNPRVDTILEEYRRTFDEAKRIELYREFQRLLNVEQPYTFLFMQKAVTAVSRRFRGVEVLASGGLRPLEWWVPKAQQKHTAQLTP